MKCKMRSKKRKFDDLAYDTFEAFEPYINVLDTGLKYKYGDAECLCHRLTRETRLLMGRYREGERDLRHANGHPFEPRHFHSAVFCAHHVHEQIHESSTYYYTSNPRDYGLAYLDVDAHHQFQTDADQALALLFDLFGADVLFARDSTRGHNGYLKIRHGGRLESFNSTLKELQQVLHLFFRQNGILCDIEVKGTITTGRKSGSLAKLPFSTFEPWRGRQSWGRRMLEEFRSKPDIELTSLVRFVARLKSFIDAEQAEAFDGRVRRLKAQEKNRTKEGEYDCLEDLLVDVARRRAVEAEPVQSDQAEASTASPSPPQPSAEVGTQALTTPVEWAHVSGRLPSIQIENGDEPDSFHRQYWALMPLHRCLKRVASEDEALEFIKGNRLYTGDWSENLGRRQARVRWILDHQARTFDAAKCGEGHVQVGKFDAWAKANFPTPITAKKRTLEGEKVKRLATWQDVGVYLSIFDFCLCTGYHGDKGVPHRRVMNLWKSLYEKGVVGRQGTDRKVKAIRETLARLEVIRIIDRKYARGKSMTYDYGPHYPDRQFWRRPEKQKTSQLIPFGDKGRLRSAVAPLPGSKASAWFCPSRCRDEKRTFRVYNNKKNKKILNTEPTSVGPWNAVSMAFQPSTGPPDDP